MQTVDFFIKDKVPAPITLGNKMLTTGNIIESELARPDFSATGGPVRAIEFRGAIDALSITGGMLAARHAAGDEQVRAVVVSIDSGQSLFDVDEVVNQVARLARKKLTVAVIHQALGTSLRIAYATRGVYAVSDATIGLLAAHGDGIVDDEAANAFALGTFDGCLIAALSAVRPDVYQRIWFRLLSNTIDSAEWLEAHDLVDACVSSEAALVDRLTRKEST